MVGGMLCLGSQVRQDIMAVEESYSTHGGQVAEREREGRSMGPRYNTPLSGWGPSASYTHGPPSQSLPSTVVPSN